MEDDDSHEAQQSTCFMDEAYTCPKQPTHQMTCYCIAFKTGV